MSSDKAVIHADSDVSNRTCMYPRHACSRPRFQAYKYCVQHIFEDPTSPFTSCEYISRSSKRKCPNPALRQKKTASIPTFCDEHLRDLIAKEKLVKRKKRLRKRKKAEKHDSETSTDKQRTKLLNQLAKYRDDNSEVPSTSQQRERSSDSESEEEVHRPITDSWHLENSEDLRNNADWDDFDPVNNEVYEPLRYADVLTPEEVVATAQSKLIRLQSLYIEQFKHLFHMLKESRRRYLVEKRREDKEERSGKAPKSSLYETHMSDEEVRALANYRKRSGVEALLRKRQKRRRLEDSGGTSDFPVEPSPPQSRCSHVSNHARCKGQCLPYTKYCTEHILEDPHQLLYKKCHVESCPTPVCQLVARSFKVLQESDDGSQPSEDVSYCLIHAPLPEMTMKLDKFEKKIEDKETKSQPAIASQDPFQNEEKMEVDQKPLTVDEYAHSSDLPSCSNTPQDSTSKTADEKHAKNYHKDTSNITSDNIGGEDVIRDHDTMKLHASDSPQLKGVTKPESGKKTELDTASSQIDVDATDGNLCPTSVQSVKIEADASREMQPLNAAANSEMKDKQEHQNDSEKRSPTSVAAEILLKKDDATAGDKQTGTFLSNDVKTEDKPTGSVSDDTKSSPPDSKINAQTPPDQSFNSAKRDVEAADSITFDWSKSVTHTEKKLDKSVMSFSPSCRKGTSLSNVNNPIGMSENSAENFENIGAGDYSKASSSTSSADSAEIPLKTLPVVSHQAKQLSDQVSHVSDAALPLLPPKPGTIDVKIKKEDQIGNSPLTKDLEKQGKLVLDPATGMMIKGSNTLSSDEFSESDSETREDRKKKKQKHTEVKEGVIVTNANNNSSNKVTTITSACDVMTSSAVTPARTMTVTSGTMSLTPVNLPPPSVVLDAAASSASAEMSSGQVVPVLVLPAVKTPMAGRPLGSVTVIPVESKITKLESAFIAQTSASLQPIMPMFERQHSFTGRGERKPSSADEEMAVVSLLSLRSGHPSDDNSHSSSTELE